jgi:hypothetical protein
MAIVATTILVVLRPVKFLARIQIILTAVIIVGFVVNFKVAMWIHSMAYDDPARKQWRSILDVIWFGTIIPWLLFTIFHVILVLCRKVRAN